MSSTIITRIAGWAAGIFYRLEQSGGPVPPGPVLVVANHPNSLLDPLIVFRTAGRPTRPLAKAPLFDQVVVGAVLRALGGLPVYRRQDDDSQMHRNEDTFRRAIDALRAGDAVQIYPEGLSHSGPAIAPLRTGAARIALAAEADADWSLGLRIVPIGITYRRKPFFRGSALACIGEPFEISDLRAMHEEDPVDAVRALTDRIRERLETLTLNLGRTEDAPLVETAERIYAREKGLARWRERDPMRQRLPRLQAFARGLAWLRLHDPDRLQRLERDVQRHRLILEALGAAEGDVPPRYARNATLWYVVRESLLLGIGLPLAALGTALWFPAYRLPGIVAARLDPEPEVIATYKVATGFIVMPLTVLLSAAAGWWVGGPRAMIAALVMVPALGFIALAWRERWDRVRQDAVLFFRVLRRRRTPQRLEARRAELVREFDEIADLAGLERAPMDAGDEHP